MNRNCLLSASLLCFSSLAAAQCPQDVGYVGATELMPPCVENTREEGIVATREVAFSEWPASPQAVGDVSKYDTQQKPLKYDSERPH